MNPSEVEREVKMIWEEGEEGEGLLLAFVQSQRLLASVFATSWKHFKGTMHQVKTIKKSHGFDFAG